MLRRPEAQPMSEDSATVGVPSTDVVLDGTTLTVRETPGGLVLVSAGPGQAGTEVLGDFVPAFPGADEMAKRILHSMASACSGLDREAWGWEKLRERFLHDHRCLTAPELAESVGDRSRDPASKARGWLRAGRVFCVYDGTSARFPQFQIDLEEGRPRREVREVLGHLREKLSDWQIAFWFVTANTWTGDWRRPLDLLGREPERLFEAARNEVATEVL